MADKTAKLIFDRNTQINVEAALDDIANIINASYYHPLTGSLYTYTAEGSSDKMSLGQLRTLLQAGQRLAFDLWLRDCRSLFCSIAFFSRFISVDFALNGVNFTHVTEITDALFAVLNSPVYFQSIVLLMVDTTGIAEDVVWEERLIAGFNSTDPVPHLLLISSKILSQMSMPATFMTTDEGNGLLRVLPRGST